MEVPVCAMILSTIGRPSDVVCGILAPNWKKDSGVHLVLTTTIARIWEFALRMEVHAYVHPPTDECVPLELRRDDHDTCI